MRFQQFLDRVRQRGGYDGPREAAAVTEAVLAVLAARLPVSDRLALAEQLPSPLPDRLFRRQETGTQRPASDDAAEPFDAAEFVRRVGRRSATTTTVARRHSGAVLSTVAETVTANELAALLTLLPGGYAPLFGVVPPRREAAPPIAADSTALPERDTPSPDSYPPPEAR